MALLTADTAEVADDAKSRPPGKKKASLAVRTASTLVLLALFVGVMWGGHIPCTLVLFAFQARCCVASGRVGFREAACSPRSADSRRLAGGQR